MSSQPGQRPLSPHLQVYRPQLTSMLSICHRMTGVFNALGSLVLIAWLVTLAQGPDSFNAMQGLIGSWIGYPLLFGWTLSVAYHLCNGLRHLAWDAGYGLELDTVYLSGKAVLAGAAGLTLLAWIVGLAVL